jgi:PQQ-dependent catabolism-associated CXXCW motif protein
MRLAYRHILFIPALLLAMTLGTPAHAAPYAEVQADRPDLFDPETGYRIARQRAPTPDDIPPPARPVTAEEARALLADGALPLDVYGAGGSRFDDLDGTWLVPEPRMSLPDAVWLPETGRGSLEPALARYLEQTLAAHTDGRRDSPIVVFCIADCWMSWNAAQRIAAMGYSDVHWFRLGTDGWLDIGGALEPVDPVPVPVE